MGEWCGTCVSHGEMGVNSGAQRRRPDGFLMILEGFILISAGQLGKISGTLLVILAS